MRPFESVVQRVGDCLGPQEEAGQGLAEYGLILALIALVAIAALTGLGNAVISALGQVVNGL